EGLGANWYLDLNLTAEEYRALKAWLPKFPASASPLFVHAPHHQPHSSRPSSPYHQLLRSVTAPFTTNSSVANVSTTTTNIGHQHRPPSSTTQPPCLARRGN
ncbi:hypothetical protein E4U11_000519, partial [Claviceps purpurea]